VNALDFIVEVVGRGVEFFVDGDRLRVIDREQATTPGERALISALKPSIRALLRTELPAERADSACAAFDALPGVAICRGCGFGLPEHFWRQPTCTFFIGSAEAAKCERCGAPWLEHRQSGVRS